MNKYILLLATVATALIAGLFFSFVVAINPAFAQLPDAEYITAMQTINVAIVNPFFAIAFFGAALLIPFAAWRYKSLLLWMAAAFYIIGGIGVTFVANVPLNDMLAASSATAATRNAFAGPWNNWHLLRTVAVIISLILLVMSCQRSSDRIV